MTPVINAFGQYTSKIEQLYTLVGELKSLRSVLELQGMPNLSNEQYAQLATGELAHIDKGKVERLFAAMTCLDMALVTPVSLAGVTMPPAKAIVDARR
jgi:hypothetical protein